MQLTQIPLNTKHLTLWLGDTQGMLFHQGEKSLYKLEPLSLALLFSLDENNDTEIAINELMDNSQLSRQQIVPHLNQVLALLKNSKSNRTYADGQYPELKNHQKQTLTGNEFTIKIASSSFAITCNDTTLKNSITELLIPITTTLNETADFKIEIKHEHDGSYSIYSNNLHVEQQLLLSQVMPVFVDRLQILSYQQSNYCFGFHGAALKSEQGRILLPGVSGAGKSTLTAELSKRGYQVYSDEIIALDNNLQLISLALPMAVKSGSWNFMNKLFPEVNQLKHWDRTDGRKLKYIWPDTLAQSNANEQLYQGNTTLLSPKYHKNAKPEAIKLSVIDIIELVTTGGYQLGVELNCTRVEQLVNFCEKITAYQISYGNSAQAHELVAELTK